MSAHISINPDKNKRLLTFETVSAHPSICHACSLSSFRASRLGYCQRWCTWCSRPTWENLENLSIHQHKTILTHQAPTGATNLRLASMPRRLQERFKSRTIKIKSARPCVLPFQKSSWFELVRTKFENPPLRMGRRSRQKRKFLVKLGGA